MKNSFSRRNFMQTSALAAAATFSSAAPAHAEAIPASGKPSPLKLGLASYTFRNFTRAQVIDFMKQLHLTDLNCKDAKDHLPMDSAQEAQAVADYAANGIKLHAVGTVYFPKDEDDDIRSKFEYAKRAGVNVIVAGDPAPATLPRIEKFVKEYDIRLAIHNHGPEDKIYHSPFDVTNVVKDMDPRIGCCIDVGHAARAGANLVEAIHAVGPRIYDLHVKDLTSFESKESQVAVGEGILPFREMFQALIEIHYKGFIDLEYEIHADDPMPGVIESFAFMRGVLDGMGYLTKAASSS
ncbi:Xylose isomerase domain-containing protein TIM barrel [Candidatus Sulfotelmatomonas gaucii]|uniref:Xylose isomerase domain-containing protein TIM barrel n=1 Tax=Candidatus Sulfuritelmatomonas gaucii TaxID=2043161 RepID=A0A2N9LN38_9BACT|nr:Xylose isomerase domain-containing protein TIM barrel [Candidatus Sulfotelmatomonas gaucii]